MAHKKTSDQISYNMSRIKSKNTTIELRLEEELKGRGLTTYVRNQKGIPGKPDFAFVARKVAVFCDGDFWHGFNWENTKKTIHSNQDYFVFGVMKLKSPLSNVRTLLKRRLEASRSLPIAQ